MNNLYCILVIYNKKIIDSPTYQFIKDKGCRCIICDNSTTDMNNKEAVEKDGHIYISMDGNKGLSKAYNKALDTIQSTNKEMDGWVILLDDDTSLQDEYIQEVKRCMHFCSDLFLPIVRDAKGIMSPCLVKEEVISRVDSKVDINAYDKYDLSGINSGMMIRLDVFKDYRYDENLFLDFVDHHFIKAMKQKEKIIHIMNVEIHQDFSAHSNDKESAKKRFTIFKKDSAYYFKKKKNYIYVVGKRKIHLLLQYKDVSFLGL
ncbi:MAG: glycosyltransferase [Holdemanella sp.]|nr:glycosyltransferase [Holdemanella sp.]